MLQAVEDSFETPIKDCKFESNGFGVGSTGQYLDRVKKNCAFVLNDVSSDLWAFWTKEKVPDTCTALLVVSFVSLYLYKLTKETTYSSAVHVSGSIKAFPFHLLLKFSKGQRI